MSMADAVYQGLIMRRIARWTIAVGLCACLTACVGKHETSSPALGVEQVLAKNAAARGGIEAWHKIDSMIWIGRAETRGNGAPARFVLAMKRPNKTRFEVVSMNHMSLRIFDGHEGWKLRPIRHSEDMSVQPYNAEEVRFARDEQIVDGPLIDHAAKGIGVKLAGVDNIDGHQAYRLELQMPSGAARRIWIDASSFLEIKSEHGARGPLGMPATVDVYYRDYRTFGGVKIPVEIESGEATARPVDKLIIERVELNPEVNDKLFERPQMGRLRSPAVPPAGRARALPHVAPPQ
jgi:hypothetical protein